MTEAADKKMVATKMTVAILEAVIKEIKKSDEPYKKFSEPQQRAFMSTLDHVIGQKVEEAVNIIVADKRKVVLAQLEQITVKDGVKATLKAGVSADALGLAEHTGQKVLIIVTGIEKFKGGDLPAVDKDQKPLFDKSQPGAGVKKDARTKRSGPRK